MLKGLAGVRVRRILRLTFALLGAATALPAAAISVDQGAVAATFIAVFAVFAVLLLLLVLGVVALVSGKPHRRDHLRATLIWFGAAIAAALLFLVVLRGAREYASFEAAVASCALFLFVAGLALVIRAFMASRRAGHA